MILKFKPAKMDNNNSIKVLNALIEINNDRIEGYETASKETEEEDLKVLFTQFEQTSRHCRAALVNEVQKLGGTATEGTTTSGKFFRVWMDIKSTLTGKDRKAILNSCEYGEDQALETYNDPLTSDLENLTAEQQTIIQAQYVLIKADHDKVKVLRNMMAVHQ